MNNTFTKSFIFCLFIFLSFSCVKEGIQGNEDCDPQLDCDIIELTYEESYEDFVNPERGFYKYSETSASNYKPLIESSLRTRRGLTGGSGATYQTYNSLVFRYFILDDFKNTEIDNTFLELVQEDFNIARNAGVKIIPRFCYTTTASSGDCNEDFICPPYGDASKDIVLQHINQLAEVINKNIDVILCIQMGMIGTWGENYYTDYFGDASSNGPSDKLFNNNWQDRIDVLESMLNSFDEELMVQVRYTQMKQRTVYGIDAKTNVPALTESEAFNGSHKSRIGLHNDCLFANFNDFGTYSDYGNDDSERKADVGVLKPYLQEDSRFVYVGGETCFDGYNPQSNCSPEGHADTELRELHYTYLNADYNNEVNNDWVDGGCMESIKLNLGYRYVLRNGKFERKLSDDRIFNVELNIDNVGYSTVMKNRPVYLILINSITGVEFRYEIETDMRRWETSVNLNTEITISEELEDGNYDVFLFLPDLHESIANRPEYSIRLGNTTEWDTETGYNNLNFTLEI